MAWYVASWKRSLWRIHLLIGLAVFLFVWVDGGYTLQAALVGLAGALVASGFMASWPMLRFKPQERWLKIDPDGLETTIGRKRGARSWRQIIAIERAGVTLALVVKGGSAFIVPDRAFASVEEREGFASAAEVWWRAQS